MQSGFERVAGWESEGIEGKKGDSNPVYICKHPVNIGISRFQLSHQWKSGIFSLVHFRSMTLVNEVKMTGTVTESSVY
jgi:hypothetical protein